MYRELTRHYEVLKLYHKEFIMNIIMRFINDEEGQGLTEYALLVFLIGISLMGVAWVFRNQIRHVYENIILNGMQAT